MSACGKGLVVDCDVIAEGSNIIGESYHESKLVFPPESEILTADKKSKTLFGSQWDDYQKRDGHKAFAANRFGVNALKSSYISEEQAKNDALATCNYYNELRKNGPKKGHRLAPCLVIAVNNNLLVDNIEKVFLQKPTYSK